MELHLKIIFVFFMAVAIPISAFSAEYEVDLGLVADLDEIRPLIDGCGDIGELEEHRSALERSPDLEEFRSFLEDTGYVEFRDCPAGFEGSDIEGGE